LVEHLIRNEGVCSSNLHIGSSEIKAPEGNSGVFFCLSAYKVLMEL